MRIFAVAALLSLISYNASYAGEESALEVDANLVTAVDVSGSMGMSGEGFQFEAIATAIEHPDFLQAIARGYNHRIGFSIITWSSEGGFSTVVDWTLISSAEHSRAIAKQLRQASPTERFGYTRPAPGPSRPLWRRGLSTDISRAVHLALDWLDTAPFSSARSVINLCTNGTDNVAEGPELARMRAIQSDTVINGLIIGDRPEIAAYFRDHIQTGPGSFVIEAKQRDDILNAMQRKFMLDLVINAEPIGDASERGFRISQLDTYYVGRFGGRGW